MLNRRKIYVLSAGNMKTGLMGTIMRSSNSFRKKKQERAETFISTINTLNCQQEACKYIPGAQEQLLAF